MFFLLITLHGYILIQINDLQINCKAVQITWQWCTDYYHWSNTLFTTCYHESYSGPEMLYITI